MIHTSKTFQNCTAAVEDIPNPQTGEIEGRAFLIINSDDNEVYRLPMGLEAAKQQGQNLLGLKGVEVATTSAAQEAIDRLHRRANGRV